MSAERKSWNQGTDNHNWRHGFAPSGPQHPFYVTWLGILARCKNPKSTSYPWYGAKGIKVCERWKKFVNFHADMFGLWRPGLEIDRIESSGDYCPENCRWVTHHQQTRNHRRNHWIEFNGERNTITDWSKKIGGAHSLIRHRLRLGWTIERALTTPPARTHRKPKCGKNEKTAAPADTRPRPSLESSHPLQTRN